MVSKICFTNKSEEGVDGNSVGKLLKLSKLGVKVSLTNCNVSSIFVFLKIFHNKSKNKLNKPNIR